MILVTGATGQVGQQVVRALRGLNQPVRALVRKGSEYYWLNDTGCQFFFGDLRDPQSLRRACRDVRYLVVCSGLTWEQRDNHHTNVTIDGHGALFQAAAERGVERAVYISCMGADRMVGVPAFDARSKAEELLVSSGLSYTILRACVTDGLFLRMAWLTHDDGRIVMPGKGDNRLSPIHTGDLALMAAASLDLAAVKNQRIDVGGPEQVTAMDAYALACAQVGVRPRAVHLPVALARLGARASRPVRRFGHRMAELSAWFSEDLAVHGPAVAATFGIPLTSLATGLARTDETVRALRDPEARERRLVHPQFYATVYQAGTAKLSELPDGPPPRRD